MEKKKFNPITWARLEEPVKEALRALSKERKRSMGYLIEQAVVQYLKRLGRL